MDVLKPFIDDGTLVVKSNQTAIEQAATERWNGEVAQSRMEDLLTKSYSDGSQVNGILSPYDGISRGIISALTDAGYTEGDAWPVITGQDAEIDSVKAINNGEQYATIFKDTRELAKKAAAMAVSALNGDTVETNDDGTYNNNVKDVPSFLLEPVIVVKDNIQTELVETGYWTEDEVNG
jgi:putative multiple sugar transport system substrate-binding protein